MIKEYPTELYWNYVGNKDYEFKIGGNFYLGQEDWNMTLITKINHINAIQHKTSPLIKKLKKIQLSTKFKDLIETITWYDKETERFNNGYQLFFEENNNTDYLLINDHFKIHIQNYPI